MSTVFAIFDLRLAKKYFSHSQKRDILTPNGA